MAADEEVLKRIDEALGRAYGRLIEDPESVHATDSQRAAHHFKNVHADQRHRSVPRTCVYPGCPRKTIKRSHTIQRAGSIEEIAENGHVLHPMIDHRCGRMSMVRIGVHEASTFPGFCSEHENLFAEFEREGSIDSDRAVILQLYRTACREWTEKQLQSESIERWLSGFREDQRRRLLSLLEEELGEGWLEEHGVKTESVAVSGVDGRVTVLENRFQSVRAHADELKENLLDHLYEGIQGRDAPVSIWVIRVGFRIPVSLAGHARFHYRSVGRLVDGPVLLNVLPSADQTLLAIATEKAHERGMAELLEYYRQADLLVLGMVETWMVHGTDHWFISPSVWNQISASGRDIVLQGILDTRWNITHPCKISLFDQLRRDLLSKARTSLRGEAPELIAELLEREESKIGRQGDFNEYLSFDESVQNLINLSAAK